MKVSEIPALVRRQIIDVLQGDLDGDELLTKEVWEQCETSDHEAAAKRELEEVLGLLRDREAAASRQSISREALTALQVTTFATYPLAELLDELVTCTVRYNLGDLAGDERRIALALLDRLAALGIAHKDHRPGCEIWPSHGLCGCPWHVPS